MKTNKLKYTILFTSIFLMFLQLSFAQSRNRDRIKTLKISFISNAIDLTSSEAEKFWPIYNNYDAKIKTLRTQLERGKFNPTKKNHSIDALSEKEAQELISKMLNTEQDVVALKKQMFNELSSVIAAKKILKLQKAEGDFNRRMLQEFGKRRRMNMNNNK